MIKGLAIGSPIQRISIGRVVEKNGKRLQEKDEQFTITSQVQNRDGWVNYPLAEELRKAASNGKVHSIQVRVLFNDPNPNLNHRKYEAAAARSRIDQIDACREQRRAGRSLDGHRLAGE